jgi:hypothetical protein
MKKQFALSLALLASAWMVGCSSSSSASEEDSSSSSASYNSEDCTLSEKGIKILLPAGDEEYKIGDSITIVFVAKEPNAGGFKVLYKANADDEGSELFANSIGDESPDGTECTEVKALLTEELTPSTEAFIRIAAYVASSNTANSNTFTVKAK